VQGAGGARLGRAPKTGAQRSRRRCREALRLLQARRSCRPDAWHRGVRRVLLRRVKRGRAWQAVRRAACGMRRAGRSARSGARSGAHGTRVAMACTQADGRARKSASARPRLADSSATKIAVRKRSVAVSPRQCCSWLSTGVSALAHGASCQRAPARRSLPVRPLPCVAPDARRAPRRAACAPRRAAMCNVPGACARARSAGFLCALKRGADEARSLTEALPPAGASADGDDDSSASVRLRATHARAGRRFAAFAALPASARRA
jgi:hypothetical protein